MDLCIWTIGILAAGSISVTMFVFELDTSIAPNVRQNKVVNRFAEMCKELGTLKLRARVGPRDESFGAVRDLAHLFTTIKYTLKGIPPVPTR